MSSYNSDISISNIVPSSPAEDVTDSITEPVADSSFNTVDDVVPVNHKTFYDLELDFNSMLKRFHRSLKPMVGKVFHHYPQHYRFITAVGAKPLAEKWSKSFQEKRTEFRDAGLWVRFFIDTTNKTIKATIEPKRSTPLVHDETATTDVIETVATTPVSVAPVSATPVPATPVSVTHVTVTPVPVTSVPVAPYPLHVPRPVLVTPMPYATYVPRPVFIPATPYGAYAPPPMPQWYWQPPVHHSYYQ